jgi:peptidoglycan/LPS O-acetylase OafA/YrhL
MRVRISVAPLPFPPSPASSSSPPVSPASVAERAEPEVAHVLRPDEQVASDHRRTLAHEPTLDGLRGLAVAAVVGYHLGLSWLKGGFLGVSLFFTLSGFLITNLLLAEHDLTGTLALTSFWARRARRLLPAACGGIGLAVVAMAIKGDADQLGHLPGDVMGALGYVANWRFVLDHSTYQAGYQAPSPLLHYWSLAIEEQLYLVLPLLVFVVARRGHARRRLGVVVSVLMVVSALATLAVGAGHDPNRVYFGTDTRMFELLAGVLLAVIVGFPTAAVAWSPRRHRAVSVLGAVGLLATVGLWVTVAEGDRWVYRGGLWGVAVLSAGTIVAATRGVGAVGVLRWKPLVGLGRISYGVYVYHWPLFLLFDGQSTGLAGIRLIAVRLTVTALVAGVSYRCLELPFRQGRWRLSGLRLACIPAIGAALLVVAVVVASQASSRAVAAVSKSTFVLSTPGSSPETQALAQKAPPPAGALPAGALPAGALPAASNPVAAPRTVLFLGDSLVFQAFPTLAARLHAQGIEAKAIGGPGQSLMTNGAAVLAKLQQSVARFDPDVVVLESCCGQMTTDGAWLGADGREIPRDSPALYAEWDHLARQATATAASRGAMVLWVLGPPLHTNGWYGPIDGHVPKVNGIYQSIASCTPGAGVVDWRAVGGPDGGFAESLPDTSGHMVRIRTSDGFHFTPAGWDLLARLTLASLDRQWVADHGRPGVTRAGCG